MNEPFCFNERCQYHSTMVPAGATAVRVATGPRTSYRTGDRPVYLCATCSGAISLFELVQMPEEVPDRVQ